MLLISRHWEETLCHDSPLNNPIMEFNLEELENSHWIRKVQELLKPFISLLFSQDSLELLSCLEILISNSSSTTVMDRLATQQAQSTHISAKTQSRLSRIQCMGKFSEPKMDVLINNFAGWDSSSVSLKKSKAFNWLTTLLQMARFKRFTLNTVLMEWSLNALTSAHKWN